MASLFKEFPPVLNFTSQFSTTVTYLEDAYHNFKFIAILYTGSPVKVISSCLARESKITPDIDLLVMYGTTDLANTKLIGAYLYLPLRFGKLVLTAASVVIENAVHYLLIATHHIMEFKGIVNHQEGFSPFLNYHIPIPPANTSFIKGLSKQRIFMLNHAANIFSLNFHVTQTKVLIPPSLLIIEEGMSIYHLALIVVPSKSYITIHTGI